MLTHKPQLLQGIGLDPDSAAVLAELGLSEQYLAHSQALQVEAYRRVDPHAEPPRAAVTLVENWAHNHRSMLWSDLHGMLLRLLPPEVLSFLHDVQKIQSAGDRVTVTAVERGRGGGMHKREFECDVVIAADGVNSFIRRQLVPNDKKR